MLLGGFKKCLLEHVVFYLNEKKVESLANAAVLADEFGLTHRSVFFFLNLRCIRTVWFPLVWGGHGQFSRTYMLQFRNLY